MSEIELIKEIIQKLEELQQMQRPHSDDFYELDRIIAVLTVKLTVLEMKRESRTKGE